ncbi:Uncharacterised protein [Vibrio cholerae]|nr:Uncharacterised protein [Vibrio cholerae]CSI56416.1 Uncharacterised protein [Vibrio cholerae]
MSALSPTPINSAANSREIAISSSNFVLSCMTLPSQNQGNKHRTT